MSACIRRTCSTTWAFRHCLVANSLLLTLPAATPDRSACSAFSSGNGNIARATRHDVIGKLIEPDHKPYTVIGVVPPRFPWGDDDVYLPALPNADPHYYWNSFVKLKPGTKYSAAQAEMQSLVDRFAKDDPKNYPQERRVKIVSLNEEVLGRFAGTLVFLFGAVVVLLLIGCANVSILLLARGTARQHELAVRTSMGAGRARLIRQLLTESVLLSVTGAALGVLAAYWGVKALSTMLPYYSFPHDGAIHVTGMLLI